MKTVHIIDAATKRVVSDPVNASILQTFLRQNEEYATVHESTVFHGFEVHNLTYSGNTFEGDIQLSYIDEDRMHFTGEFHYDDGPVIDEVSYFANDLEISEFSFIASDREYLREFITGHLYDRFNPEMYSEWLKDYESSHEQFLEDEMMGN